MNRPSSVSITGYVRRVSWHHLDLSVDHGPIAPGLFIRSLCRRLSAPGFAGMLSLVPATAGQRAKLILRARAADKSVAVQLFPPIDHLPTELLGPKPKESLRLTKFSQ